MRGVLSRMGVYVETRQRDGKGQGNGVGLGLQGVGGMLWLQAHAQGLFRMKGSSKKVKTVYLNKVPMPMAAPMVID